jgi:hypothetical protein
MVFAALLAQQVGTPLPQHQRIFDWSIERLTTLLTTKC